MRVTDKQWLVVVSQFYPPHRPKSSNGLRETRLRSVFEGILWVLRSGSPWQELPPEFPSYQTCHRWYVRWVADGTLERVLSLLAADVEARGGVDVPRAISAALQTLGNGNPWKPPRIPAGPQPWPQRTVQTLAAVLILRITGRNP